MATEFLTLADCSLAYQRQVGDAKRPGVFFLGGFAADMTGTKASFLAECCRENDLNFIRFDYRGCGQSPGNFLDGSIGAWLADALAIFDRLTQGPQIVVGSSMGGWLSLLLARAHPQRLRALIGISAAPDFTEDLIWDKLTKPQQETLLRDGKLFGSKAIPDPAIPLTMAFIEDGRKHLVLRMPLAVSCPMRLLHGMRDEQVPNDIPQRIADHVAQEDVRITYIKNGDHRLNKPENLDLVWQTVAEFIQPAN